MADEGKGAAGSGGLSEPTGTLGGEGAEAGEGKNVELEALKSELETVKTQLTEAAGSGKELRQTVQEQQRRIEGMQDELLVGLEDVKTPTGGTPLPEEGGFKESDLSEEGRHILRSVTGELTKLRKEVDEKAGGVETKVDQMMVYRLERERLKADNPEIFPIVSSVAHSIGQSRPKATTQELWDDAKKILQPYLDAKVDVDARKKAEEERIASEKPEGPAGGKEGPPEDFDAFVAEQYDALGIGGTEE